MTEIHRASSRGHANHGWLDSHHTFSFASYHDPSRMGFGLLRVLNDDIVQPSKGFDTHPHKDMEIISIPLSGALIHKDSMGNEHIIRAGEVQRMSAGTGVTHSEFNHSDTNDVNFLQIWILPEKTGINPGYEQTAFDQQRKKNTWQLVVSPDGRDGSLSINQQVYFSLLDIQADQSLDYNKYNSESGLYCFVIDGVLSVAGNDLDKRDGLALVDEAAKATVVAKADSQLLVIETPLQ